MRLALYSDLHTEFDGGTPWTPPPLEVDVIIFAGDNATTTSQLRSFAEKVESQQEHASHVIYLCGNHEFYGGSSRFGDKGYEKYRTALNGLRRSRLLEMEAIAILGYTFIGATLWAPVSLDADPTINDYRLIRIDEAPYRRLQPADVLRRYRRTLDFLDNTVTRATPTIVITHHPPTSLGLNISPEDVTANLARFIFDRQPAAWLHGHAHQSHHDEIGGTKVVSNPRGYYPNGLNPDFHDSFVLSFP